MQWKTYRLISGVAEDCRRGRVPQDDFFRASVGHDDRLADRSPQRADAELCGGGPGARVRATHTDPLFRLRCSPGRSSAYRPACATTPTREELGPWGPKSCLSEAK